MTSKLVYKVGVYKKKKPNILILVRIKERIFMLRETAVRFLQSPALQCKIVEMWIIKQIQEQTCLNYNK